MDNQNNRLSRLDDLEGDSVALKLFKLFSDTIALTSINIPYDEIFSEALSLLDLDWIGYYLFDADQKSVEHEYSYASPDITPEPINPWEYLSFIRQEKSNILIKVDKTPGAYELVVIPVQFGRQFLGVLIARNSDFTRSFDWARAIEQLAIQLGWASREKILNQHLLMENQQLLLDNQDLMETLRKESFDALDNEVKIESMKAQLLQREKLSAMGRLITGVAHEIKNPMTGVVGYVSMISSLFDRLELRQKYAHLIEGLEMSVSHMESVLTNFLSFARNREKQFDRVRFSDVIYRTEGIIKNHLLVRRIKLLINVEAIHACIYGDINQLVQVFMNLILNAEQAIPGEDGVIDIHAVLKGENVICELRDNGVGIKEEHIHLIFDSFFTTKGLENSSGTGLYVSKQIIEDHGGSIHVVSRENLGTKFIISLPVMPE